MQRMASAGVSTIMKRVAVVLVLAGIGLGIWFWRKPAHSSAAADSKQPTPTATAPTPTTPARPIDHVTKLSPTEHQQLADRIAAAQQKRQASPSTGAAAISAPERPHLPEAGSDEPAISKTQIRDAMREVIPIISECYQAAIPTLKEPNISITAHIMLTGDPDVGTLIDADQILDEAGQPLPAKFDDCLRSTFQSLALPPLAEGDKLEVHYPFRFESQ